MTTLDQLKETRARYRTRFVEVSVEFSTSERTISTLEGPIHCVAGDAIVTGVAGEQWPVQRNVFLQRYHPTGGQPQGVPGKYAKRTAYVQAVQLKHAVSITLSDERGTLQGKAGDWVVWYSDEDAAIVAEDIFPVLYEPA